MIYCQIYNYLLFKHCSKKELSNEKKNWIMSLFDIQYSSARFLFVSYQLCSLYSDKIFDDSFDILGMDYPEFKILGSPYVYLRKIKFSRDRNSFIYILLHKSGNLLFESMNNFLFDNSKYSKIPISFKFHSDGQSPHGDSVSDPIAFFDHDIVHMHLVLSNMKFYNFDIIISMSQKFKKGTVKRRMVDMFLHYQVFEYHYTEYDKVGKINIFENYENSFSEIIYFDVYDMGSLFEYLMSSEDITDNNLICEYKKYNIEQIEFRKYSKDEMEKQLREMRENSNNVKFGRKYHEDVEEILQNLHRDFLKCFCNSNVDCFNLD